MAEAQDYSISQLTEDTTAADTDLVEVAKDNGNGTYSSRKQTRETLLSGMATEEQLEEIELTPGPQGEPGPQGPQGIQGVKGDKGDTGDTGPQGIQGVAGPKGDTGDTGPQGIQGPKGDDGEPGPPGEAGPAGANGASAYAVAVAEGFIGTEADWLESLIGPEGPQGPAGADGPQGPQGDPGAAGQGLPVGGTAGQIPAKASNDDFDIEWIEPPAGGEGTQGPQGEPGEDGDSAYEVAVANGFEGTQVEWLASLVGPEGPQGAQGIQGIPGEKGDTGDTGPQGIQGEPGIQGAPGADGEGVPTGGTTGQMLAKTSDADFDTEWVDAPTGGGVGGSQTAHVPIVTFSNQTIAIATNGNANSAGSTAAPGGAYKAYARDGGIRYGAMGGVNYNMPIGIRDVAGMYGVAECSMSITNSGNPANTVIAYLRFFMSGSETNISSNVSAGNNVGLRWSASFGNTNVFSFSIVSDGVAATQTNIGYSTREVARVLRWVCLENGDIEFYDDETGDLVSTHTVNLPTFSDSLFFAFHVAAAAGVGSYDHSLFIHRGEIGVTR